MKMKVVTYGQLRDALDHLIKSGARKANEPLHMNGRYWPEIVDCRAKTGAKLRGGGDQTKEKTIARGKVAVTVQPDTRLRLV